jgi:hypothetical protein
MGTIFQEYFPEFPFWDGLGRPTVWKSGLAESAFSLLKPAPQALL